MQDGTGPDEEESVGRPRSVFDESAFEGKRSPDIHGRHYGGQKGPKFTNKGSIMRWIEGKSTKSNCLLSF